MILAAILPACGSEVSDDTGSGGAVGSGGSGAGTTVGGPSSGSTTGSGGSSGSTTGSGGSGGSGGGTSSGSTTGSGEEACGDLTCAPDEHCVACEDSEFPEDFFSFACELDEVPEGSFRCSTSTCLVGLEYCDYDPGFEPCLDSALCRPLPDCPNPCDCIDLTECTDGSCRLDPEGNVQVECHESSP